MWLIVVNSNNMEDTKPRVSVLMTAYNVEAYIGEAIEGILAQNFSDFEFLILDDGSTDSTWHKILAYQGLDKRIKAWHGESNSGISAARNKLVGLATAEYIAWQDADDISLPDRLGLQYKFMSARPEVGICGGFLEFFDTSGVLSVRKYAADDASLRKSIFRYSPVAQPVSMIRRELLLASLPYDLRWPGSEDLHMSFKIGERSQFANIQKVLVRYRQQPGSVTFRRLRMLELNTFRIRWRFVRSSKYHFGLLDLFYNLAQAASFWLMPVGWRIALFNFFRNER